MEREDISRAAADLSARIGFLEGSKFEYKHGELYLTREGEEGETIMSLPHFLYQLNFHTAMSLYALKETPCDRITKSRTSITETLRLRDSEQT